ncbi:MAG: restriction endonuclease subunit S [Alphaproteobacteria bacterium]|uniref:restriction endonuclease subunit S n=1 Tax=Hyphomonas sp. TaxID=87 RepID=UPI001DFDF804|nr:restriction endonuclease subunit S [Alphaproteobacteria bacterium]MBU2083026.1 restriction endonuclease subunit S [Alphaproteobacteria bacterium]MBU2144675.1 restriction endonuclease subunit S [Alphaproteobacteria bacterium]MBU2195310.1 restriction endonuclease subunit S [Alphaproteobacteria bacterium]
MQEENLLSLSYGNIIRKDLNATDGLLPESFETYQIVEAGNIVMRLTDLQNDKRSLRQGLVTERGIITSAYDALEVAPDNDPRFWAYALLALDLAKYYYSLGGGVRQSIKFADFPNDWVQRPDRDTQRAIADFLDRETARIDQLVAKKQRMAGLLGEKLDRTVRSYVSGEADYPADEQRRATGIGYLTTVPKHWSVEKIGWRYEIQLGKMLDGAKQTGQNLRRYLRVADVQWGKINTIDLPVMDFSASDRKRFRLLPGDLLVNEGGSYVGRSAVWRSTEREVYYQKALHRVRPRQSKRDTADFLYYLMWFATKYGVFIAGGNQTTIDHLTAEAFSRYRFAFPTLEEQFEISERLQSEEAKHTNISAKVNASIASLREFRAALITAAVTGQLDISGHARKGDTDRRLDAIEAEMRA